MAAKRNHDKAGSTVLWLKAAALSLVLLAVFSSSGAWSRQAVWAQVLQLPPKTVALDPGHGGVDTGAAGRGGLTEKDITLPVCRYLQEYLLLSGVRVILTRHDDLALSADYKEDLRLRIAMLEDSGAGSLVSIHGNSYPAAGEYGAQTFYWDNHPASSRMASCIQEELKKIELLGDNRREAAKADFYILRHSPVPAVLVELGFLSNPQEEALLGDPHYQKNLAWRLFSGLVQFWRCEESGRRLKPGNR